jgi:hypothetical protein
MNAFTPTHLEAMRAMLRTGLTALPRTRYASFTAVLQAGERRLLLTVRDGHGELTEAPGDTKADFCLRGTEEAWGGFLAGDGKVGHASVIGMVIQGPASDGVLTSELTADGDLVKLFANLPTLNTVLEAAATPHGGGRVP